MTLAEIEETVNVGQTISVMKFCHVETDNYSRPLYICHAAVAISP